MGRWVYAERRRGQCQKPLDGRSDQRYCSSTCRSAASRSHRAQYAAAVLDMLNPDYWQRGIDAANTPGRHTALAASARDAAWAGLLEITNYNGPKWRARAEQVHMRRPDVWNELTGSVILAAARPRTMGACRWCDALSRAAMADEVIIPDAAHRETARQPMRPVRRAGRQRHNLRVEDPGRVPPHPPRPGARTWPGAPPRKRARSTRRAASSAPLPGSPPSTASHGPTPTTGNCATSPGVAAPRISRCPDPRSPGCISPTPGSGRPGPTRSAEHDPGRCGPRGHRRNRHLRR